MEEEGWWGVGGGGGFGGFVGGEGVGFEGDLEDVRSRHFGALMGGGSGGRWEDGRRICRPKPKTDGTGFDLEVVVEAAVVAW